MSFLSIVGCVESMYEQPCLSMTGLGRVVNLGTAMPLYVV